MGAPGPGVPKKPFLLLGVEQPGSPRRRKRALNRREKGFWLSLSRNRRPLDPLAGQNSSYFLYLFAPAHKCKSWYRIDRESVMGTGRENPDLENTGNEPGVRRLPTPSIEPASVNSRPPDPSHVRHVADAQKFRLLGHNRCNSRRVPAMRKFRNTPTPQQKQGFHDIRCHCARKPCGFRRFRRLHRRRYWRCTPVWARNRHRIIDLDRPILSQ
jgi:hypothetical protein